MNVFQALEYAKRELLYSAFGGNIRVGLEAELLLSFALDSTREWLHTWGEREIEKTDLDEFVQCVCRRTVGEPIEYITQSVSFYGEAFYVDQRVLIPRPETEILVEKLQAIIKTHNIKQIGEIGIGSGIISIMLGLLNLDIEIIATDISMSALEVACINIDRFSTSANKLKERIKLVNTNLFEGVEQKPQLLISNPPYIPNGFPLERNVLYEPSEALFGGVKGDEILKGIIDFASVNKIEFLACEMGYDQKESLEKYLSANGYQGDFYKDLSGLDRGFIARNKSFF